MKSEIDKPEILKAWRGESTDRIPLWLMRQAGRYLPEYRELRAKAGSFLKLCYTPEMAAEVTLQPLRRFDLDAAILFSDILVVPHALGQTLDFVEGEGPRLAPVRSAGELSFDGFEAAIAPVLETVTLVRSGLEKDKALIGFAGSPWTVASYMIHGRGGHDFGMIKSMNRGDLMGIFDVLVDATTRYLSAQIDAGAQAIQVFESWAGAVPANDFDELVIAPNRAIIAALKAKYPDVPVIGFPRGCANEDIVRFVQQTGVDAVGLGQDVNTGWAAEALQPSVCVQGNLAPELLLQGGSVMVEKAHEICGALGNGPFVFNLGHGVIKETNPDHVAALVDAVHGFQVKVAA